MSAENWPPDPPRPPRAPPILNLPPMVTRLVVASLVVHLLWLVLPTEWRQLFLLGFGFIPARYTIAESLAWPALVGPISHQFMHGGLLHLGLNMVMLVAFGSGVERAIGGRRMLGFYLACGVIGAFTHLLVYPESMVPVVGASGAISGLFGGVLRLLAVRARATGRAVRILPAALIWVALAFVTGFIGMPGAGGASIAWAAHVGGFVAGLALFGPFVPRRPPA